MRSFNVGDTATFNELRLEVRKGRKMGPTGEEDLILYMYNGYEHRKVPMPLVYYIAQFLYENEDVLYPPERGFEGGEKFLDAVTEAARNGWEQQAEKLAGERRDRKSVG